MDDRLESYGYLRDVDAEAGRATAVISTGDIARDGAMIDPNGWDFTNYDRNPVVLWMHDTAAVPFARTVERILTETELIAKAQFDLEDARGAEMFRKVQGGYVNATSVRWLPRKSEVRKIGANKEARDVLVFTEQELLEWSFVTIPADPKALIVRADGSPLDAGALIADAKIVYVDENGVEVPDVDWDREITSEDKSILTAQIKKLSMLDLVATHRRLHQMAAKGNVLTGFSKADMNWFHAATETELRRRAKDDGRPPPDPSPLGWRAGDEETEVEAEEGHHFPGQVGVIGKKKRKKAAALSGSAAARERECEAGNVRLLEAVADYAASRITRPSTETLLVRALAKTTGKTEERIRRELADSRRD